MLQKLVIDVQTDRPIQDYKDGYVLVYYEQGGYYMIMSRENLLAPQNQKINKLEEDFRALKRNMEEKEKRLEDKYKTFETTQKEEKEKFLATYKETNDSVLEMVKAVVNKE